MREKREPQRLTIEERLYADEHRPSEISHLTLQSVERCEECDGRPCTRVCPAETYQWNDQERRLLIRFENCLECGACRTVCPHANIEWRYPMGGMGICYRYG